MFNHTPVAPIDSCDTVQEMRDWIAMYERETGLPGGSLSREAQPVLDAACRRISSFHSLWTARLRIVPITAADREAIAALLPNVISFEAVARHRALWDASQDSQVKSRLEPV